MYSPAPYHYQLSKDIEGDENVILSQNNNIFNHLNNENENVASDNNDDNNNNNDKNNKVVAPIIENSPLHPPIERESSSKSILTFNGNNVQNASSSRRLVHTKPMDVDSPSIIMATFRNVTGDKDKGSIGVRIIAIARGVASSMNRKRGMEENVVVGLNFNQNTLV